MIIAQKVEHQMKRIFRNSISFGRQIQLQKLCIVFQDQSDFHRISRLYLNCVHLYVS